jgi:hypothetical protein
MKRTATLIAAVAVSGGCSGDETITIELDDVNGSGITGLVELRAAGDSTRMTVTKVDGGTITGARVVSHSTCPEINDRYAITPPTGIIQVPFEFLRESRDDLTAAFLRHGRYVACGST